jgi:hypothetical protein
MADPLVSSHTVLTDSMVDRAVQMWMDYGTPAEMPEKIANREAMRAVIEDALLSIGFPPGLEWGQSFHQWYWNNGDPCCVYCGTKASCSGQGAPAGQPAMCSRDRSERCHSPEYCAREGCQL